MAAREGCPLSRGWEKRIGAKTAVAGAAGTLTGSVLAILRQASLMQYSIGMGASMAFCIGVYGSLVEVMRRLRCKDDTLNSIVAGSAAAYTLVGIHQGDRRKATAAAIYCGAAAGLAHAADSYFGVSQMLRPQTQAEAAAAAAAEQRAAEPYRGLQEGEVPPWWERWLPIRRMSEDEWQQHQHEKQHGFKQRVDAVVDGGLPVMLERERQRLQERQASSPEAQPGSGHRRQ